MPRFKVKHRTLSVKGKLRLALISLSPPSTTSVQTGTNVFGERSNYRAEQREGFLVYIQYQHELTSYKRVIKCCTAE